MTAPIIAITSWRRALPTYLGDETDLYTLGVEYADTVVAAGGIPIMVGAIDPDSVVSLIGHVDGLLLSGGQDLGLPGDVDAARDATEFALLDAARARQVPVFGICRGLQAINVFSGGTLVADLPHTPAHPELAPDADQSATRHEVTTGGGWVEESLPADRMVNSIHHQAIDALGDGLEQVAWAPDGTIEAVQGSDPDWFLRAVQWHPEKLPGPDGRAHATQILADFIARSSELARVRN